MTTSMHISASRLAEAIEVLEGEIARLKWNPYGVEWDGLRGSPEFNYELGRRDGMRAALELLKAKREPPTIQERV